MGVNGLAKQYPHNGISGLKICKCENNYTRPSAQKPHCLKQLQPVYKFWWTIWKGDIMYQGVWNTAYSDVVSIAVESREAELHIYWTWKWLFWTCNFIWYNIW